MKYDRGQTTRLRISTRVMEQLRLGWLATTKKMLAQLYGGDE